MPNAYQYSLIGNPIIFETFWDQQKNQEICTGFDINLNQIPPNRNNQIVIEKLIDLYNFGDVGIHLECSSKHRRIIFGQSGKSVYPDNFSKQFWLAEIELKNENSPAFDWLTMMTDDGQEPEEKTFCAGNIYTEKGPPIWSFTVDYSGGAINTPLSMPSRAGGTVRIFSQ